MDFNEEFTSIEKMNIKNEFLRVNCTYLDTAGAALYGHNQIRMITEELTHNLFFNPHTSKTTESVVDQVRYRVLKHFNADPEEYSVIFTSGATASLKLVGECFQFSNDGAFYYLTDSHTSVLGMREIVGTEKIIPLSKDQLLKDDLIILGSSLITYPAQCNFNGFKYSLDLIEKFHRNTSFVCLDAASFASTNFIDLNQYKADYVCLSFYKIFGYPTGLGALIVSKRGGEKLVKKYYGGGTVKIALTRSNWHLKRDVIHERFEDGTISFLSIVSLQSSFRFMENLLGVNFIHRISRHVFEIGKYLYKKLKNLKHHNGSSVVTFHQDTEFDDLKTQGGIVNFSIRHSNGSFVGFAEFDSIAAIHNIVLRTGCFCNPGSCQTHLNLTHEDLLKQFNEGHICGDNNDLIDGLPTGSIRVSFGYMTTIENIDDFVKIVEECYVEGEGKCKEIKKIPSSISMKPILKSIRIYPVKSCASMVIDGSWTINSKGLKHDREFMIINGNNGTSLTQKNEPRMCLIRPFVDEGKMVMKLEFPDFEMVEVSLKYEKQQSRVAKICETKVCGERIQGFDCGDEVAEWLSCVLAIDNLRLIRHDENIVRKHGSISLSNQAQFLLISEPSVNWLMNQVELWDEPEKDIDIEQVVDRFRGNLIVDNLEPLAENDFKCIQIGRNKFEAQGPCTRCQMICIDQRTGEKTTEPLRTIGKLFKGKMKFGIYLKHLNVDEMVINSGDTLEDLDFL